MSFCAPDYLFRDIYEITPDFFISRGISFVLSDIDNTLVTYDDPEPTEKVARWFETMREAGITFAFVSNNHEERVKLFNRTLGYKYIYEAKKPLTRKTRRLMKECKADKERSAFLGDQILTDTMCAHFIGIISVNVPPIKDRTGSFFKFKRKIESIFMKRYWKSHADSENLRRLWEIKTGNRKKEG